MKKVLSIFLVFALVISLFAATTITVSAAVNHTQAEAIDWIKARGNENWWDDVDGLHGCQCVDLTKAYYTYLVGYSVSGSGKDYASNSLPSGWYRDNNPTPGCVFYSTSGSNGHVGLVYSVSGSTLYTVETNTISPYDGGSNSYARFITRSTSSVSGYIHPDFPTHTHSYGSWQTVTAATCTSNGSKKRVCSCGDTQTQTIAALGHSWNSGTVTTQPGCETKGVKTFTCSRCNGTKTENINALGHDYKATTVPATCMESAYTKYTCSRCNNTYTEEIDGWTVWSADAPPSDAKEVERKTQYRYRNKQTDYGTSSTKSGWETEGSEWVKKSSGTRYYFSRPSGFNNRDYTGYATSALSSSTTSTTKREVSSSSHNSYIYWHWAYPYTYGVGTNTLIGLFYGDTCDTYPDSATVWEAFESTNDIREHTYSDGCVRVSGHSSYSYNWFITETYKQTYTDYEKQYKYYKWGDWSEWQDTAVTATSDRQVETRTVYRYKDDGNKAGHTYYYWNNNSTHHWHTCIVCKEVADIAAHIYDNDKDTTCNICGYIRDIQPEVNETDPQVVIGSVNAKPGETVKIKGSLKNCGKLTSVAVSDIIYNTSALSLVSVEWLAKDPTMKSWNNNTAKGVISYSEEQDLNGDIIELTFIVKDEAAEGDYQVAFTCKAGNNSEPEEIAAVPGTVTVKHYVTGDMNGDGQITDQDAIYLLFHVFFPEDYPENQPCDFNKDGQITDQDAIYLLFHVFFKDEYPIV